MNNKNYRVMKFFEPINKKDKSRGYVRLDIRGVKGNIIVSVENLGDARTTSEVFLYKDKSNKIKLGDVNNKKGMLKKLLTFGNNNAIEDYNVCAVVKDNKIVMYSNLFNAASLEQIKKLELDNDENIKKEVDRLEEKPQKVAKVEQEEAKKEVDEKEEVVEKEEIAKEIINKEVITNKEMIVEDKEQLKEKAEKHLDKDEIVKKTSVSSAVDIFEEESKDELAEKKIIQEAQAQTTKSRNKFEENLYNILKDYKKVEPLSVKIKDFDWWYIPYDETGVRNGLLPYYNQVISSYYPYPMSNRVTTCSSLMKKYKHYIFGLYKEKGEIAKFIYGVPGEFAKEEQPYKGITGFKNWSYSNNEDKDKHGYWLAFVNPRTGDTTEPPEIVVL